jgi:hypothetical protein
MRLGQAERVVGAVRADLERVQRQPQVVDRRGGAGEVVDDVDRFVDEVRLDDVDVLEPELRRADMRDVGEGTRLEVVDADHAVTASQQLVTEMRAEEPSATRHEASGH